MRPISSEAGAGSNLTICAEPGFAGFSVRVRPAAYDPAVVIGDVLWSAVRDCEPACVDLVLTPLDDAGLREARAWHARERAALNRWLKSQEARDSSTWTDRALLQALLLLWLDSPSAAADGVDWDLSRIYDRSRHLARRAMDRRGDAWLKVFVLRLAERGKGPYDLIRTECDRLGLPHPTDDRTVGLWLREVAVPRLTYSYQRKDEDVVAKTLERLVDDARTSELWSVALGNSQVGSYPSYTGAVARLVADGALDRVVVIESVTTHLTTPGKPYGQRALVQLLSDLDVKPAEIPGGLPMLQGFIATLHGSASAPLLPLALELVETGDDLQELVTTVTGRGEKGVRRAVLSFLVAGSTRTRLGHDAVRAGLEPFTTLDDETMAERARTALGMPTVAESLPTGLGLWELAPDVPAPEPPSYFGEPLTFDLDPALLVRGAMRDSSFWAGGLPPVWRLPADLETLVRWAHDEGVAHVRTALQGAPLDTYGHSVFGRLVTAWVEQRPLVLGPNPHSPHSREDLVGLLEHHLVESLSRLGTAPFLLSTPSYADGTIRLDSLVGRLRRSTHFGPLDLALALLRTRRVAPERARELEGLDRVPPDKGSGVASTSIDDAVSYVREHVARDGLRPPQVAWDRLEAEGWLLDEGPAPEEFWQAELPIDLSTFGLSTRSLLPRGLRVGDVQYRMVAPHAVDLRVRGDAFAWGRVISQGSMLYTNPMRAPGVPGVLSHRSLLNRYAHFSHHIRNEAVETTVRLVAEKRYAVRPAMAAALLCVRSGHLNLTRWAEAWEQLFLAGCLRTVGPVAFGVGMGVDWQARRSPAGLADLLRMLTRYAPEVPGLKASDALRSFAAQKGETKARAEARRLVGVVDA
jgi:hypothetical protein